MTPDGNNLAWRVYRTARIPHQLHQYAGQYWLLESLRNASVGVMTNNIEEACLVWVDMYCYQQVCCWMKGTRCGEASPSSWECNSL